MGNPVTGCTCSYVGLPCEHYSGPNRGRNSQLPCPSEAAYRRELRHRAADPSAPVHAECRRAARLARLARLGRTEDGAEVVDLTEAVDPAGLYPCECPPVLPTLEATLTYAHGYLWVPGLGWVHE